MSETRRTRHGRRGGFTLLEISISAGLLAVVLSAMALLGGSTSRLYGSSTLDSDLETRSQRAVRELALELMRSGSDVLLPDPGVLGDDSLSFRQAVGLAGETVVWGSLQRIELELAPGEVNDGQDNNGNGLVDEGQIVWTRNEGEPNERRTVLCSHVREYLEGEVPNGQDDNGNGLIDERGLSFDRVGDRLTIRLTLMRVDSEGRTTTRTHEALVRLRN